MFYAYWSESTRHERETAPAIRKKKLDTYIYL